MSRSQAPTGQPSIYRNIALPLARLGYAPLPTRSKGDKAPAVAFGHLTELTNKQWVEQVQEWDSSHPAALWLLDALAGSAAPDLDVLDYDDLTDMPWGVDTFGATPLTQSTGREGGGQHHFYRRDKSRPRGEHGSIVKFILGKAIDWKTWHGYVVAPGSLHKSGRAYQLYWNGTPISASDLTVDMLNSLPVLDRKRIDEVAVAQDKPVENLAEFTFSDPDPYRPPNPRPGDRFTAKMPREVKSAQAKIPAGCLPFQGMTVEEVAKRAGPGPVKVACPHAADGKAHKSDLHGAGAAKLQVDSDRRPVYMVCFACNRVYTYGTTPSRVMGAAPPVNESIHRVRLGKEHLTASGHLDLKALLPHTVGRHVMVLQVGRGRGKTTLAADVVNNLKRSRGGDSWTVAVSPTRSLTSALSSVMGLPHYEDNTDRNIDTSIAVCLPSLPRVSSLSMRFDPDTFDITEEQNPNLLVLEEVEQQIRTLAGSHLDNWQATQAWHALVHQVVGAELILMLDADAGPLTQYLLSVAGRLKDTTWFYGHEEAPRDFIFYKQAARWHADLAAAIKRGERPYVYTQSVAEAETIARMHPGVTLITGGERGTIHEYDLGKINEWALQGSGLVTTPCLGTGVSIDPVGSFDSVWVWGNDALCTADDVLQGINRPRHPKSTVVRCFFRPARKPELWEQDPKEVLRCWAGRANATMKLVGFNKAYPSNLVVYENGEPVNNPGAQSYAHAMALAYAEGARGGRGWTAEALIQRVKQLGGSVTWVDTEPPCAETKAISEERQTARAEVNEEAIEAVVNATDLTPEQAEEVKRRGPRNRAEALGAKRNALRRFYGKVDRDTVEFDDDGRGRSAARAMAHMESVRSGGWAEGSVKHMDERELDAGVSLPRMKNLTLRARGTLTMLNKIGVGPVLLKWSDQTTARHPAQNQYTLKAAKVGEFGAWAATNDGRAALTLLGYTVRRDVATNPMQLVGSILRGIGLNLHTKKVSGERTYFIDRADYDRIQSFIAPYKRMLASGIILGLRAGELEDLDNMSHEYAGGMLTPEGAEQLEAYLDSLVS